LAKTYDGLKKTKMCSQWEEDLSKIKTEECIEIIHLITPWDVKALLDQASHLDSIQLFDWVD